MSSSLDWRVVAAFVFALAFDVAFPVLLVLWARRRHGFSLRAVGVGAAAFAISQLFLRLPLLQLSQYLLRDRLKADPDFLLAFLLVAALTAGIFEEGARWIAFKRFLPKGRTFEEGLGFGLGHGGFESAVLIGGLVALGLVNTVVLSSLDPATLPLGPAELQQVIDAKTKVAALRFWEPLLGAWERVGAIALHVALSLLVLRGVLSGDRRMLVAAILVHGAVNAAVAVLNQKLGALAAEGAMALVLAGSLAATAALRGRLPSRTGGVRPLG